MDLMDFAVRNARKARPVWQQLNEVHLACPAEYLDMTRRAAEIGLPQSVLDMVLKIIGEQHGCDLVEACERLTHSLRIVSERPRAVLPMGAPWSI